MRQLIVEAEMVSPVRATTCSLTQWLSGEVAPGSLFNYAELELSQRKEANKI